MSEGNLLDQQQHQSRQHHHHHHHHHHHQSKLFSSRDSELEALDTTTPTTSSPELRSRSQSVGSAHREALLFFEENRLFQNSPELLEYGKARELYDCELRSISSCSRTSSPANRFIDHQASSSRGLHAGSRKQQQEQSSNSGLLCHQQQVQYGQQASSFRQQSDSNLLESSTGAGVNNQRNNSHCFETQSSSQNSTSGRARSQSQGQCGSVRRKPDQGSHVIVVHTTNQKGGGGGGGGESVTQKASKWLEEIQFTAQYQHYRTNNYASVVSSASSLDKSDGGTSAGGIGGGGAASTSSTSGDQPQQYAGQLSAQARNKQRDSSEAESRSRNSGKPASSSSSQQQQQAQAHHYQRHRHHSHQLPKSGNQERILVGTRGGGEEGEEELQPNTTSDDLNRQNSITTKQCWNFPRVKLRKLFTAKSLDDILGARSNAGGASRRGARKSLPLASVSSTRGEVSESDPRSSSSPEIVCRTSNPKKAQLLRDNKLSLPRSRHDDDKSHLLFVKPVRDGSKSPGAHSSKSAIVISSTTGVAAKHRKAPTFIKATRQKSRSFSALTSALLSRVPGHTSSSANSPCSSSTSSTTGTGLSVFFTKRSHQQDKNVPPVIPAKKAGHVPCAKSDNCLNRFVASATCAKFVDYFSETSARVSKSATSTTTLVEPFGQDHQYPGTPSSSSATGGGQTSSSSVAVVTAQPRKWTAIKNKWDQKLQASGDRQKEIGASLASVSNNAQIFRKSHHQHHQQRQRSSSLSPLDNPDEGKSTESLLEITSPSPTLQEVRFLDTPEIRYASPIAVRSSRGDYSPYGDDDDDSDSLTEGAHCSVKLGKDKDTTSTTACSSDTESFCSECKENDDEESEDMTRHHKSGAAAGAGGGTKRSRDHHHRHSKHHGQSSSKEKPKLVVANVTYLQRPMSPGLLLRDPSPSSATSGTMDQFGNLVGGSGDPAGGHLSSTVIRNNVFTSNSNNNQQSKSQQAKLEFLKGFSHSSQQPQHQQQTTFPRRDPLCANTSANVNENRSGGGVGYFGGAFSTSISPSSSGASEKDNNAYSGSSSRGGLGANTIVRGGNVQGAGRMHPQPFQVDDLQDPLNRRAAMFADTNLRSSVGDPLVTMGGGGGGGGRDSGRGPTSLTMKSTKCITDDEESPPRYGAEQCSLGNQAFFGSSERHHQGAMGSSGGGGSSSSDTMQSGMGYSTNYGARTTDSQSTGSDPDSKSGNAGGGGGGHTQLNTGEPSFSLNQGPAALAQSTVNNNLYIDVDLEGAEDTMGDLQSPQYVKRTAHMFDSRFSTEDGANGHGRNVRNPSYLNVSRSVSGYSCLTYNNGTVTSESVSNKTLVGNGTSLLSGGTRVGTAATRLKTDFAIHSPFSRKVVHTDEDSDHSSSQSATSPPPSLPPINTTSTRFTESPFFNNGMSRGNDLMDETPYIPSHGKSFIMQRIERLYGSDAVTNKGALTRKSSNVTTISITRESPPRGTERIIPIKVESRDDHQNNLYNNGAVSKQHEISTEDEVVVLPGGGGGNVESIRHVQQRLSRDSFDDTDEDEDGIRTTSHTSPTKVRSPTGLDNSGHLNGNGNANPYGNGVAGGAHVRQNGSFEERIPSDLPTDGNVKLIHANGNHHSIEVEGQDCTSMKKALSRESSAESDVTNECSENSLELGVSDAESKRTVYRKDSQDDSLYSSRGSTSPSKPKPKPKPKDMALLRTLSRSPALKTETENLDKTVISLNIVQQPESTCNTDHIQTIVIEDQTDADSNFTLSDIKNTISAAAKVIPESKGVSSDKENHHGSPDKENAPNTAPIESLGKIETTPEVKDGNYFKKEMTRVTIDILKFSEHAAKELDSIDPSEDRAGSIHAAIGKGNLLVKKKFKQFHELCDANLKGAEAEGPVTTNEDLAGFWDMVLIQVDQIYSLFADLERKEENEPEPRTPTKSASPKRVPVSTTKSTSKTSVGATPKVNSAAAKARDEARRKMIAEKRRAMQKQMQEAQETTPEVNETEVQIFAPETPHTG